MAAEVNLCVGQEPLGHLKLDVLVSQKGLVILGRALGSVAQNIGHCVLLVGIDRVVDGGDDFLVLLIPLDLLITDPSDLFLSLRIHDLILEDSLLVDLLCLLFLLRHKLSRPLNFHLPVVGSNGRRDVGLGDKEVEDVEAAVREFGHGNAKRIKDGLGEVNKPGVVDLVNGVVGAEVLNALGDPVVDEHLLHMVTKLGHQVVHFGIFNCGNDPL